MEQKILKLLNSGNINDIRVALTLMSEWGIDKLKIFFIQYGDYRERGGWHTLVSNSIIVRSIPLTCLYKSTCCGKGIIIHTSSKVLLLDRRGYSLAMHEYNMYDKS